MKIGFHTRSWLWGNVSGLFWGIALGIFLTCAILLPGDTHYPDFWNAVCR